MDDSKENYPKTSIGTTKKTEPQFDTIFAAGSHDMLCRRLYLAEEMLEPIRQLLANSPETNSRIWNIQIQHNPSLGLHSLR